MTVNGIILHHHSKLLMHSGGYKNICDVKPNQYIINIFGKPRKITHVHPVLSVIPQDFVKIQTDRWFEPFLLQKNCRVLHTDDDASGNSLSITSISCCNTFLLPRINNDNAFHFLPGLLSCYGLDDHNDDTFLYNVGYLIGVFLMCGRIENTTKTVLFKSKDASKICKLALNVFRVLNVSNTCKLVNDREFVILHSPVVHFFQNIIETFMQNRLDSKFLSRDQQYIEGLYNGLSVHDESNSTPIELADLAMWCLFRIKTDATLDPNINMHFRPARVLSIEPDSQEEDSTMPYENTFWHIETADSIDNVIANNIPIIAPCRSLDGSAVLQLASEVLYSSTFPSLQK